MPEHPVDRATLISGAIIVVVNSFFAMASAFGWLEWNSEQRDLINAFILAVINLAALIGPSLWARPKVTPLQAPKDEDGTPLVKADTGGPTNAQARAIARGK